VVDDTRTGGTTSDYGRPTTGGVMYIWLIFIRFRNVRLYEDHGIK
jgi:hypothetical protein